MSSKNAGIINICKPPGMTSFDVVNWLKKIFHADKAGHTGTLDPRAAGVLPVCMEKGTKIIPFLPEEKKEYHCEIELGLETTTHDREGEIAEQSRNWQSLSREEIQSVLDNYLGWIEQIPPMYSAVKKNGKKLYELARKGKEVEREAREVHIESLEITYLKLPLIHIKVTCSRGTYIRALTRDIGRDLDCGGVLNFLLRSTSGPFKLENSLTPKELKTEKNLSARLMPLTAPLNFVELKVKNYALERAVNGAELAREDFENPQNIAITESKNKEDNKYIIRGPDNLFIAISSLKQKNDEIHLKPERVFNLEE